MKYFLRKCECKMDFRRKAEVHFLFKSSRSDTTTCPTGKFHFAPAKFHISVRKYFTFPPGKISLGVAKRDFRNALFGVRFLRSVYMEISRRGDLYGRPPPQRGGSVPIALRLPGRPQGSPLRAQKLQSPAVIARGRFIRAASAWAGDLCRSPHPRCPQTVPR